MNSPVVRLIGRAVVAALLALLVQLQAADHWDASILRSALCAAALAGLELVTPLNKTVGVGK